MPFQIKPQGEAVGGDTLMGGSADTLPEAINAAFQLWQHYLTPVEIWQDTKRIGVWLGFVFDE